MRKNNLVKNTAILSFGTLLTKGIQFIMIPLFSRWLSTEDYGTFDVIVTLITMAIPFVTLACGEGIFRFCVNEENQQNQKAVITSGVIFACLNVTIVSILIVIVSIISGWDLGICFVAFFITEVLNEILRAFLRGIKRLDLYSISSILNIVFIGIFTTLFILFFELGLKGIILGYTVGNFIEIILLLLISNFSN